MVQPYRPPNASAVIRPRRPTRYRAEPVRSNERRPVAGESSRRTTTPSTMPMMPIGTLNQNTVRQPIPVRKPPRIGPSIRPAPTTIALIPSARPSSRRGNASVTRAADVAMINAPPTPWTMRPAISSVAVGARPQNTDATVNTASPSGEHAGAPQHVGEAPGVEDEDGRDQRVADDDPEQREQVGVEVAEDVGQGDDERARVERRQERAEAGDAEHPPAVRRRDG